METTTIQLEPIDGRKSFYGKAVAIEDNETIKCKSYSTIVAEYDKKTDTLTVNGWYSATTARHIDSFCRYVGKNLLTKQEMEDRVSY